MSQIESNSTGVEVHSPPISSRASSRALRAGSEDPSIFSYTSSVDKIFLIKDVHGRELNNTNDFYLLPADQDEHGRLDIQHEMLKTRMGLFLRPSVVKRLLARKPDEDPPCVLDIGCGSGSWTLDMAHTFPHAEIIGLDLVPANITRTIPPNAHFEVDDANEDLSHYHNTFSIVHARCICTGIKDYPKFLDDMVKLIIPGGVLLLVEGEGGMYDTEFKLMTVDDENDPSFSWAQRIIFTANEVMRARGSGVDTPPLIKGYMPHVASLSEWGARNYFIHVGPWEENMTQKETHAAHCLREDFARLVGAVRPMILTGGHDPAVIDLWIARAQDEILNMQKRMYVNWVAFWGIKATPASTPSNARSTTSQPTSEP